MNAGRSKQHSCLPNHPHINISSHPSQAPNYPFIRPTGLVLCLICMIFSRENCKSLTLIPIFTKATVQFWGNHRTKSKTVRAPLLAQSRMTEPMKHDASSTCADQRSDPNGIYYVILQNKNTSRTIFLQYLFQ